MTNILQRAEDQVLHQKWTSPIYDRNYPSLRRFPWVWRSLAIYATFVTWLSSLPWLILRGIAPHSIQGDLYDFERGVLSFITPILNFFQDTTYRIFSFTDYLVDVLLNSSQHFYHHNLKGLEHKIDDLLSNIEQRMRLLKHKGLNGIPGALSLDVPYEGGVAGKLIHSVHAPMGPKSEGKVL